MKKMTLASIVFLASSLSIAQTTYCGQIDLTSASNGARIPTEVNAGAYSVEMTIIPSKAREVDNIVTSFSRYRDDNEMVCDATTSFKIGQAILKIKSLTDKWETTVAQDLYATAERSESYQRGEGNVTCPSVYSFQGAQNYKLYPAPVTVVLPLRDARFKVAKLNIQPINDGIDANYYIEAGSLPDTSKVTAPGRPLEAALQLAGNKVMAYELMLEVNGYYYFGVKYTPSNKVSR